MLGLRRKIMLGLKGVERLECSFDDLEKRVPWFVEGIRNRIIIVEDAVVGLEQGKLLWARGIWKGGIWKNGIWSNGTWERGTWKSGWWNNGTWLGGWWYKGTWNNGTWVTGKDFKGITHVYAPNTWKIIKYEDKLSFKKKVISELETFIEKIKSL